MKRRIKRLKNKGIDTEKGLYYCSGSEELYHEVLDTVLEEGPEKEKLIRRCVSIQDIKGYYLEIHALKNIAATIGAAELSEMAGQHCEAIKKGNDVWDVLWNEEVEILLNKYEELLNLIRKYK